MPKTLVTPELAATLKTVRTQKGIQAKDLAKHIERSNAYITKLEKAELKYIDNDLLDKIFAYLLGDDLDNDTIAKKIHEIQNPQTSNEEALEKQMWFLNFDTVLRRIPIPEKLISFIVEKINSNHIDRNILLNRINANEALTDDQINDENIEFNRWFSFNLGDLKTNRIKIKLSEQRFNAILDKEDLFSPYIFVFCILLYVLKIEKYGNRTKITFDENTELMDLTTQLLNEYRFYSLIEKNKLIASAENQEQINEIWNSFDTENQEIISDILTGFQYASELDIANTNPRLKGFSENMHWDLWFMLKLVSFNFASLDDLSTTIKKELLTEIEELIQKYNSLPTAQKKVETY